MNINRLNSQELVDEFAESQTGGQKILIYLQQLGKSIHGHPDLSSYCICTDYILAFRGILEQVRGIADSIPPFTSKESEQRYGNLAFRNFLSKVEELIVELVQRNFESNSIKLPEHRIEEIAVYLKQSFGNATRIDYGSGHELNFLAATLVANEAIYFIDEETEVGDAPGKGVADPDGGESIAGLDVAPASATADLTPASITADLNPADAIPLVRLARDVVVDEDVGVDTIFGCYVPYLYLVRYLQSRYRLEPAGSRGAWGLDDYQFLGFLLGSYQIDDSDLRVPRPSEAAERSVVQMKKNSYLYFNMISHIMETKGEFAPFNLISPMLYDISQVSSWSKIAQGFEKMFVNEILKALPIMQHFPRPGKTFL